jgi:hypothetical protein
MRSPFSRRERFTLWWSYQRYALLLAAGAVAIVAAIAAFAPGVWWLWLAAAVPVVRLAGYAREVHERYPRKLRATVLAVRRMDAGRFRARSLAPYCGDPCFRVVAREILRRARFSSVESRRLIRSLRSHQSG